MLTSITRYLKHIPGWTTNRKLFVIESDDWGGTRMPSNSVKELLIKKGLNLSNNFLQYDILASSEDLECLYEILMKYKDFKGYNVKFSPFVNVTNPDFDKIIESDYQEYYYEFFTETLKKYYQNNVFDYWLQGMENNVFSPQYHGREHFNVPSLMRHLQSDDESFKFAFKNGVVHMPIQLKNDTHRTLDSLAPAYYFFNQDDLKSHKESLNSGLEIFKNILGKNPMSFAAPNGIFHPELEDVFKNTTIENLVVNKERIEPSPGGGIQKRDFRFKFGSINKNNQLYYRRNVKFEPVQSSYNYKKVISEIEAAFLMRKPVIMTSHRINFVGSLNKEHRDKNLREFDKVLEYVIKKHPDVEFIDSGELGKIMRKKN
jgi:hypothetical protein